MRLLVVLAVLVLSTLSVTEVISQSNSITISSQYPSSGATCSVAYISDNICSNGDVKRSQRQADCSVTLVTIDDCTSGEFCSHGVCYGPQCVDDSDCPDWQECLTGECRTTQESVEAQECTTDQHVECSDGSIVTVKYCINGEYFESGKECPTPLEPVTEGGSTDYSLVPRIVIVVAIAGFIIIYYLLRKKNHATQADNVSKQDSSQPPQPPLPPAYVDEECNEEGSECVPGQKRG